MRNYSYLFRERINRLFFLLLKLNKFKNEYFIYTNLIYIYIIYNLKINLVI